MFWELAEHLEQGRVGPVDVLDHDELRPPGRRRVEICLPGVEEPPAGDVLAVGNAVVTDDADAAEDRALCICGVAASAESLVEVRAGLDDDLRRGIAVEDPRLCLEDLAQRPKGEPAAVREAA